MLHHMKGLKLCTLSTAMWVNPYRGVQKHIHNIVHSCGYVYILAYVFHRKNNNIISNIKGRSKGSVNLSTTFNSLCLNFIHSTRSCAKHVNNDVQREEKGREFVHRKKRSNNQRKITTFSGKRTLTHTTEVFIIYRNVL